MTDSRTPNVGSRLTFKTVYLMVKSIWQEFRHAYIKRYD